MRTQRRASAERTAELLAEGKRVMYLYLDRLRQEQERGPRGPQSVVLIVERILQTGCLPNASARSEVRIPMSVRAQWLVGMSWVFARLGKDKTFVLRERLSCSDRNEPTYAEIAAKMTRPNRAWTADEVRKLFRDAVPEMLRVMSDRGISAELETPMMVVARRAADVSVSVDDLERIERVSKRFGRTVKRLAVVYRARLARQREAV